MHFKSDNIPFVTGDTHYFHKNIIEYENRPFASEGEMRKTMIENYNLKVPKDGTCFFVGDVAMVGTSQWEKIKALLNKLNGTKHLILGNHDEIKPFRYIDCGFASVHTNLTVSVDIDDSIVPRRKITQNFFLAHDPKMWSHLPEDHIFLCAHVHKFFKIMPEKDTINVGVDNWGFSPITMKRAYKYLMNKKAYLFKQFNEKFESIPAREEVIKPDTETG